MARHKFLLRLFAGLSLVMIAALLVGVFAFTNQTHAASSAKSLGTPRFVTFHHNFPEAALSGSGASLKHWTSSFTSGGTKYTYTMVGTNPANGSKTSTIPVTIVPLVMKFSDGSTLDGSQKVAITTNSPFFKKAQFTSGNTQYLDAIQRAEFWKFVSTKSANYHVLLGTPTVATPVTLTIPAASGATTTDSSTGKKIGLVDINWLDPQLQTLLSSGKFTQNELPIFLSNNVYSTEGSPVITNCCIGGYHSVTSSMQTYAWSTVSDEGVQGGFGQDVSALSHELAEWVNDPYTNNTVPNWISPIAPQYGCNNFLEVGDPLVGVTFTVKGFSGDHLQDEAFFSWFARQKPSIGYKGQYTYLGTFKSLSKTC